MDNPRDGGEGSTENMGGNQGSLLQPVGIGVPGRASCCSPPLGGFCAGSLGVALEGPWPCCSPRDEEGQLWG